MKKPIISLCLLLICLPPCAAQTTHSPSRTHPHPRRIVMPAASVRRTASPAPDTVSPAAGRPFPDVPKDHWAAAAVETLRQRGIVVGYPASK